jgi:hypothetical protein
MCKKINRKKYFEKLITDSDSSTPITFGQVLWKIIPFVFTLLLDQSVKCGHTSKQADNLCLLDSSLRERE